MLPTDEEMKAVLGAGETNKSVERFKKLAFIAQPLLQTLAKEALHEEWGQNSYALQKYLAVHIPWAIEQGAYTASEDQIFFAAGHLQTRYGTPLYLAFEKNNNPAHSQPLFCKYVGSNPSAPNLPVPAEIPTGGTINKAAEIVMLHEHILKDNADRVPFLSKTPPVAQMCAVSGAIQWSLNRGLEIPYFYFGRMSYLVPLYLQSRENITQAPDLIAPIQVSSHSLVVRTVLMPQMPYANARVAVERHDRLPSWMLDAWNNHAKEVSEQQMDDAETGK